ncbi:MAG: hypothetical protein QF805_24875, partial [Pirellulaceae bacterium]|nr:hypothetical protein [Pirellulaceae bacterium]
MSGLASVGVRSVDIGAVPFPVARFATRTFEAAGCTHIRRSPYDPDAIDYLLERHYRAKGRPLRRCHARDLLLQVRNYCAYNELEFEMAPDYFDRIAHGFFTEVRTRDHQSADTLFENAE